jgi:hypothetical protein
LNFTENASVVVRAKTNEEAETAIWDEFSQIPDLKIMAIEDAPEDVVAELQSRTSTPTERTLN